MLSSLIQMIRVPGFTIGGCSGEVNTRVEINKKFELFIVNIFLSINLTYVLGAQKIISLRLFF